jgi:hypothetical protein
MKRIQYLLFFLYSFNLHAQDFSVYVHHDLEVLKDSLWIKHKLWNSANAFNSIYKDNMYFDSTMDNISFIPIPVFTFSPAAVNYDYGLNLFSFLEKDSNSVNGLILKNDSIVGIIIGFNFTGPWLCTLSRFQKQDHPYLELEKLNNDLKKSIYTISPIGFIWYNLGNLTYVLQPFGKFVPAESLIKSYVSLETIRNMYSKKNYGFTNNIPRVGFVTVDTILKSIHKIHSDSIIVDQK